MSALLGCFGHFALLLVPWCLRGHPSLLSAPLSSQGLLWGQGHVLAGMGWDNLPLHLGDSFPLFMPPLSPTHWGAALAAPIFSVLQTVSPSPCSEPALCSQDCLLPAAAHISRAVSSSICTHFPLCPWSPSHAYVQENAIPTVSAGSISRGNKLHPACGCPGTSGLLSYPLSGLEA